MVAIRKPFLRVWDPGLVFVDQIRKARAQGFYTRDQWRAADAGKPRRNLQ